MKGNTITNTKQLQQQLITSLSFSKGNEFCAIATKKNHLITIYRINTLNNVDTWEPLQELKQHTQTISQIDWSNDYKLITASHDRSVVVWKQSQNNRWEKMLVNIDIKLSILAARWAPSNKKFSLGASCSTLALGYYNSEEKCWLISTRSNFIKSPITTLSFHPSSNLLAVGSSDFSLKVVTASFKKSKDPNVIASKVEEYTYDGPFKNIDSLFEVIFTIDNLGGWINHVSFENKGNKLLVIPHHNHIKVFEINQSKQFVVSEEDIRWNGLPFLNGLINDRQELLLAGYDKKIARFIRKEKYVFENYLDKNEKTSTSKNKKGIVAQYTMGIQKKTSLFTEGPAQSEHLNAIKVTQCRQTPVSYDINGVIHFWA